MMAVLVEGRRAISRARALVRLAPVSPATVTMIASRVQEAFLIVVGGYEGCVENVAAVWEPLLVRRYLMDR